MVEEFMSKMGQECPTGLMIPDDKTRLLRCDLIREELEEFCTASGVLLTDDVIESHHGMPNLEKVADAIGDLLYVVYGAAVAWGIKIDPVFGAIHQANMLKLTGPKRADGKQLKPEGWTPPDIKAVLDAQMA